MADEDAFMGGTVRAALMFRLAAKDPSMEDHPRRVAALAVRIGERLGADGAPPAAAGARLAAS